MVKLIEDSEDVCYEEGKDDESNQDSDCIHDEESNSDKHNNSLFETNLKMDKFLNTLKRNSSYSINDNNDDGELHKIGQHLYSTDNDNSNEESMDFSDKGTGGKVDIVQNDEGSVTFIHHMMIIIIDQLLYISLTTLSSFVFFIKVDVYAISIHFFRRITQCLRQSA